MTLVYLFWWKPTPGRSCLTMLDQSFESFAPYEGTGMFGPFWSNPELHVDYSCILSLTMDVPSVNLWIKLVVEVLFISSFSLDTLKSREGASSQNHFTGYRSNVRTLCLLKTAAVVFFKESRYAIPYYTKMKLFDTRYHLSSTLVLLSKEHLLFNP